MKQKKTRKESLIENIKLFLSTYALALLIRTFIIEASQIPSQSMVPSLLVGDTLMVEKVSLGAYIPVLKKKIPSFSSPKINDMVVFVSPSWKSPSLADELITFLTLSIINKDNTFSNPKILVKRLVAGPGDVLGMTNFQLYRNSILLNEDFISVSTQSVYSGGRRRGDHIYDLFVEYDDGKERVIQHSMDRSSLASNSILAFEDEGFIYALRALLLEGFPDIRIPQKNIPVQMSNLNLYELYLWSYLIAHESGSQNVNIRDNQIYLDDRLIEEWIPQDDYYFMMGDNRDFSEDSRYFGFVPKQNIYGRILFRYWPFNRLSIGANLLPKNAQSLKF